jgi:cytochrome c2
MNRLVILMLVLSLACAKKEAPAAQQTPAAPAGDAARGSQLVTDYGCTMCHAIPSIAGPQGSLGPSLAGLASRPSISQGAVSNTPENVAKFIQNPTALNPQSSMPPVAMPDADARDIAAFLLSK